LEAVEPKRAQGINEQPDLDAFLRLLDQGLQNFCGDVVIVEDIGADKDAFPGIADLLHEGAIGLCAIRVQGEAVAPGTARNAVGTKDAVNGVGLFQGEISYRLEAEHGFCFGTDAFARTKDKVERYRQMGQQDDGQQPGDHAGGASPLIHHMQEGADKKDLAYHQKDVGKGHAEPFYMHGLQEGGRTRKEKDETGRL